MNRLLVILSSFLICGCELVVVGTRADFATQNYVEFNQKSALGAIYLFKAELDSNNVPAASQMIKQEDGMAYLAIERYEKFYDIHRIKRMISLAEITDIKADTLSSNQMRYNLEFNFRRKLFFNALKVENNWFITDMGNYE
ncbi:MAG: hypothetical protein KIT33_03285 [Candidatus Kapabacteria bacterium]|nr:hypothetical protein [Ignavibacteriota bacterium]MCW5883974.1 hypothetical protein [Candidatus Kapabacteria bacterium]